MENQAALLTGATGFVGSHLAKRLVDDKWSVHLIVRPHSKYTLIDSIIKDVTIHRYEGTIESMMEIMKAVKPSMVFHLASASMMDHRPEDIENMMQSNIAFGTQLLEAMHKNNVSYLVNTGTSWQNLNNEMYNPVCLYAATKQAFEDIVRFYSEAYALKAITLRLFDTYGPKDPRSKIMTLLQKYADKDQVLSMSPGEQLIDLVYISDVVDAFVLAAKRLMEEQIRKPEVYAVSSNHPIALKEVVSVFTNVTGKRVLIQWGGRPYRNREVMVPWNNGMALPGWTPKISLEEGIKKIIF